MSQRINYLYKFGIFTFDVNAGRLFRDGARVSLKPKVLETLLVLIEGNGRVIYKEDLMRRLWPDSFVEEANLTVNVSQLRKALGETENGERFIETVPKKGYRFIPRVTKIVVGQTDTVVRERIRTPVVIDEKGV